MIDFKINDVSLDIASKAIYNRNRKEQADSGSVTLLNSSGTRYEPYTRCSINNEQYLIESDNMTEQRNGQYEHILTLIENIAIASAVFPVDRSFKRVPALTINQVLRIYRLELQYYQGFYFDYDDTDTIYNAKLVDKEYSGLNFAVILYDLFRTINAIPRLTWNDGWQLSYELYTDTGSALTLNVENRQSSVNDIDYATNVLAKTRNAVSEDEGHIYWPSATTFMTPRAKGTMYKTSDLQFELDSDIMAIYEIIARVSAYIYTGGTQYLVSVDVDITDMTKEADVYEALPVSTDANPNVPQVFTGEPSFTYTYYKQNCIRWTKESNVIDSLWWKQDGNIFIVNVNSLINAIKTHLPFALYEQYADTYNLEDNYWTASILSTEIVEDIPIRVKYRPRRDIDFITEKNIVSGFNQATILNNQKDASIEIGRYLQNSNAIVNRIGNEVFNLTQTFDTYAEAWKLGDYYLVGNRRWVLTSVTYTEDRTMISCDGEFTVNFSNVNRETSITRQPSPYLYTGKGVQSNFIYKEYLIFDKTAITYYDNSFLTAFSKRTIMNIFDYSATYDKPLRHMIYRRLGGLEYIDKQLFGAGSGNVILLHAAFNDARLAGKSFIKQSGSWYQDPVWYVNLAEELLSATVELHATHSLITDTETYKYYPKINDGDNVHTKNLSLRFDKDPNDSLAITFEFITVSQDEDVIVGNGFTRFNNLIRDLGSATLTVYSNTEPYTIFDVKPKGTIMATAIVTLTDDYVEVTDALGDPIEYWAIVYSDEIVLAGNNSVSKAYYGMTRTRLYGAIVADLDVVIEIGELFENDLITATFNFQENTVLDIAARENDVIAITMIFQDNVRINALLREEDRAAATINFVDDTATPTVQYITTSGGEHTFRVYNNDSAAAYIYADENESPTSNRGLVASGAYVTVYLTDFPIEIEACYAKAKADSKNYSTITSASTEGA